MDYFCCVFEKLHEKGNSVNLYGLVCELRDVCVGAAVAICCPECVEVCVCVCLGWKSGAGTINISALSFTPWGGAIVTPRLEKQTGRPFSLLTSAIKNCKFCLVFFLKYILFICFSVFYLVTFSQLYFDRSKNDVKKLHLLTMCKKCD